jgi:hypothetical protein
MTKEEANKFMSLGLAYCAKVEGLSIHAAFATEEDCLRWIRENQGIIRQYIILNAREFF